jgi:hypothetical protein
MLGLALLVGGVVTPAWAMEFHWPEIGSETQTQQQEIDAARRDRAWDQLDQSRQMRDLQDQVDELRAQQRRLQAEHDDRD